MICNLGDPMSIRNPVPLHPAQHHIFFLAKKRYTDIDNKSTKSPISNKRKRCAARNAPDYLAEFLENQLPANFTMYNSYRVTFKKFC